MCKPSCRDYDHPNQKDYHKIEYFIPSETHSAEYKA